MITNKYRVEYLKWVTKVIIRLFCLIIIFHSIYSLAFSQSKFNSGELRRLEQEVKKFEEQGKYNEAIAKLSKILTLTDIPDSTRFKIVNWMVKINKKSSKQLNDDYISALQMALHYHPTDSISYELGMAYMKRNIFTEGVKFLSQAIEINPSNSKALFELGRFYYFETDNYSKAQGFLMRCVEIDKSNIDAKYFLALTFYQNNKLSEARYLLENALNLQPKKNEIILLLADIYLKESKLEKAVEMYQNAIFFAQDDKEKKLAAEGLKSATQKIGNLKRQQQVWNEQSSIIDIYSPLDNRIDIAFEKLNQLLIANPLYRVQFDSLKLIFWTKLMEEGQKKSREKKWSTAALLFDKAERFAINDRLRQEASEAKIEAKVKREYEKDLTKIFASAQKQLELNLPPPNALNAFIDLIINKPDEFVIRDSTNYKLNVSKYRIGKAAYINREWFDAVAFLREISTSDTSINLDRLKMLNKSKTNIIIDHLLNQAKHYNTIGKLDSSFLFANTAWILEPNNQELKELAGELCNNIADEAFEKKDKERAKFYYQALLTQIDPDNKHALNKLNEIQKNLNILIFDSWSYILIILIFVLFWPLFWLIWWRFRYRSKLERLAFRRYLMEKLRLSFRKKIHPKYIKAFVLLWLITFCFIGLFFLFKQHPTGIYFDISSNAIKFDFLDESKSKQKSFLAIDKLPISAIYLNGIKEIRMTVDSFYEIQNSNVELKKETLCLKPAVDGATFEITFLPCENNVHGKLVTYLNFSEETSLIVKGLKEQKILPIKFETKNVGNNAVSLFFDSDFDIELTSCILNRDKVAYDVIHPNQRRRFRVVPIYTRAPIDINFDSGSAASMDLDANNEALEIITNKVAGLKITNIDFKIPGSSNSSIKSGKIGYNIKGKESTKLEENNYYTMKAEKPRITSFKIDNSNINVKFKTTATHLKWVRDLDDLQKGGIEEIPTRFECIIKNSIISFIIAFFAWLIPTVIACLKWLSSRKVTHGKENL